ncbi:Importin subunit alpha [Strongyloides ratti]|uniref:Importin subunit alpha n=1 Tax=Strongyloides ratti TaxID=34506 RepID=A0A090L8A1_STRRB|nr:Importin subunit alpha [Strongyloides ratti]CEF65982.1 Importin subunit alpha [Strongyloides ratti]
MASLSDRTNKEIDNVRGQQYKNNGKCDELKRRRAEVRVFLRKEKRDFILNKKRNIIPDSIDSKVNLETSEALSIAEGELVSIADEFKNREMEENIPLYLYRDIRRILSQHSVAPIDCLLHLGLLKILVNGLKSKDKDIVYESAWSITNIASGTSDHTKAVVDAGVIPILLQYLNNHHYNSELTEQCIWALANIVGDSQQYRDIAMKSGLFKSIEVIMKDLGELPITVVRNIAWLFSNLARHKNTSLPSEVFQQSVKYVRDLLRYNDIAVRNDACWGLSYLIKDASDDQLKYFATQPIFHYMISFLGSDENYLILGALRVIGRFAQGTERYCDVLIQSGIFKQIFPCLLQRKSYDVDILYSCIWILSNVVAGPEAHINEIVSCNLIPFVIKNLSSGISKVRIECSWFLSNFVNGCSKHQVKEIVKNNGIKVIISGLKNSVGNDYICNLLECMYYILDTYSSCLPEKLEYIKDTIEECGGLDIFEDFQLGDNEKISSISVKIIESFFQDEDNICGDGYDSEENDQYIKSQRMEL